MLRPRSHSCVRLLSVAVFTLVFLFAVNGASAGDTEKSVSETTRDVPLWPFISGAVVGLFFLLRSVYVHFKTRRVRAMIFPKLNLQRRLYAPYSGGNFATVSFGSEPDA